MSKDISVIIHTRNEKENIKECIKSVQRLTNEIILVDMESEDETKQIAERLRIEIYTFPKSDYVEPARKFGIEKAETPWVFILDADERITPELAKEIDVILGRNGVTTPESDLSAEASAKVDSGQDEYSTVTRQARMTHYKIPRKNIFGKLKWLKYGGWWPDYQIRLIKKEAFIDWPKEIHSTPAIKGDCGYLKNPLVHFFHGNFETMVNKTVVFESIEADLLSKAKKPVSILTFLRKFTGELFRRLFKSLGFLDGSFGIIESIYQAFSKTITYIFLYEKYLQKDCDL